MKIKAKKIVPIRRGDPNKYLQAQAYLSKLEVGEWSYFEDIPEELFDEVFDLIDENWKYEYWTDDFDVAFKKVWKE
jgi:hypothetical protein